MAVQLPSETYQVLIYSLLVLCRLTQVRWSRYNPSFLEPEVNKELYQKPFNELSEEEQEKQELKAVHPIKAAPPSISSSVFSDPMIRSEEAPSLLQLGPLEPDTWELNYPSWPCCAACCLLLQHNLFIWVNLFPQSQSFE